MQKSHDPASVYVIIFTPQPEPVIVIKSVSYREQIADHGDSFQKFEFKNNSNYCHCARYSFLPGNLG
jgi:hypothetical protein